jgi:hypothetical protein
MSERGVIAIDRGLFDHHRFKAEPFSEREAWMWMIGQCAFKNHSKRIGSVVVSLERGQFAASLRFMATAWRWPEARVRRFLVRLSKDLVRKNQVHDAAMISLKIDAGLTHVTLLNYDKIQFGATETDAAPTQHRRKIEEPKNEEVVREEGRGSISGLARQTAEEAAKRCGFDDPLSWPLGWYGFAARIEQGFAAGWTREDVLAGVERGVKSLGRPPDSFKYFEKIIARVMAERQSPIPKVEIIQQENSNVVQVIQPQRRGNVADAVGIRLAGLRQIQRDSELRERDQPGEGDLRDGAGRDHVPLLSQN